MSKMDKEIKNKIYLEMIKGAVIMLIFFLVFLVVYKTETEVYGIRKYLLDFAGLIVILTIISALIHLLIKKYFIANVFSIIFSPIPLFVYEYFRCINLSVGQGMKWCGLNSFFIFFVAEIFLIPILLAITNIFRIVREQGTKATKFISR
jgi:hypothetical protein